MLITFHKFIEYCRYQRNLSEQTCAAYMSDFRMFRDWIFGRKDRITVDRIAPEDVQAYIIHLRKSGRAQNTVLRHMNALSSFMDYCVKWHGLKDNPVRFCERGKRVRHKVVVPPPEMIARLIGSLVTTTETESAVFHLFVYAGLRFSEVLSITWERVNFPEGEIIVLGKGNKERKVPMFEELRVALAKLAAARTTVSGRKLEGPVVTTRRGRPGHRRMLRRLWALRCRELQEHGFTFHSFRRYFATRLYRQGIGPVEIKELLGHEDLNTTLAYIEPSMQTIKERLKGVRM